MTEPVTGQYVTTEGDTLYYEVRGQGTPLLLIAGGGGDARWYEPVAKLLADEFKVITYDRRANARSTMNAPQNFEISQQSRDAVAVLHAAGEESAFVFGNSSGAVIALDMAKTQPQAVRAVIAHEPPLARVHPYAASWQRFFASVHWMAYRFSPTLAVLRFALGVGLPLREFAKAARASEASTTGPENRISRAETSQVLVQVELLPVTNYVPDIEQIKRNGTRMYMAAGQESLDKKRFYAQTVPILAEKFGCDRVIFPGSHVSFFGMPDTWSAVLRDVLRRAQA